MQITAAPSVPTAGTPAFWPAQREAVALFSALREHLDDAERALPVLREIAAHGRARQLLTAHGHDADQLLRSCEGCLAMWQRDEDDEDDDLEGGTDAPPSGEDWCPRGCQPLFRMDCGMCGHPGPGVWADAVSTVAEYCCHCQARTYQDRDGICERCGRNAEGDDEPPPASPPAAPRQRPGCRHVPLGTRGMCDEHRCPVDAPSGGEHPGRDPDRPPPAPGGMPSSLACNQVPTHSILAKEQP